MLAVFSTLFLTSNVMAQQSYVCQNGIKVCGEDASVSCSTFCTARLGDAVGYFAQPAEQICSDDTPCVDPSNPQFTSPPSIEELTAVGANVGNAGGNSQNIATNVASLPLGVSVSDMVESALANAGGNSQNIVTNLNSDSLPGIPTPGVPAGVLESLATIVSLADLPEQADSVPCVELFQALGLC